jgi:hypothetical protein
LCPRGPRSCQLALFLAASCPGAPQTRRPRFLLSFLDRQCLARGARQFPRWVGGGKRTPWASLFVGERDSSSSSPGQGKPAPKVVTPSPAFPISSPTRSSCLTAVLYCAGVLESPTRLISERVIFDPRIGIGTSAVAADTDEGQGSPGAEPERERTSNLECSLALVAGPPVHPSWLGSLLRMIQCKKGNRWSQS